MNTNYFAPRFEVRMNGERLVDDVSRFITEITVSHKLSEMDTFSLTVANPYPELPWTQPEHAQQFREGNPVEIKLGYGDTLHSLMEGEIDSVSMSFPSGGVPTLVVAGFNLMKRLDGSSKSRAFSGQTDKQIADLIASEAGLTPKTQGTQISYNSLMQESETDMSFLVRRARRIGFELRVVGKRLLFGPPGTSDNSRYTLVWGVSKHEIHPGSGTMSLTSLNLALKLANQVSKVVVLYPDSNDDKSVEATEADLDRGLGGTETGPRALGKTVEHREEELVETEQEAKELARALLNGIARSFVTGSGTTIGLPDLRAGDVVALAGLGPRFSGRYYVVETTHSFGSGGYTTSFSIERNAVG